MNRAGDEVLVLPSPWVTVVLTQMNVPGVRVGVAVDQPVVGATVSEEFTAYSTTEETIASSMPAS